MKDKKPFYVLDMFPYPSGEGLHVGHPKGYIATDIYTRYKKMNGYEVIHPMGWDAFGLPAEQFALKHKIHPSIAVSRNISNFKSQLQKINFDYDWDREISTTDPKFYKWTQWIFKQLYKHNLAFQTIAPINWCPSCKTGLANEDLNGNQCERCDSVVEKRPLRQWSLKITDYADRLIDDLDKLNWPEHIKTAQRNWIGRSEGSEIEFKVKYNPLNPAEHLPQGGDTTHSFTVFTTRADTLFGCTYTVLAPEHELVKELIDKKIITNIDEVSKYIDEVKQKTDIERSAEGREKTGVRLDGVMAINPAYTVNMKAGDTIPEAAYVPIYIADYVLASYGTGAIMAVPAHDERDYEFAKKYGININTVINGADKYSDGVLINSASFDGLSSAEARVKITEAVDGKLVKKYKLRDWVFARQRYWGEPFPIVYEMTPKAAPSTGETPRSGEVVEWVPDYSKPHLVADSELPVLLPEVESYEPTGTGESPLANIDSFTHVYGYINDNNEFVSSSPTLEKEEDNESTSNIKLFYRETNTMPQWAGSSWYWLRFLDPNNDNQLISKEIDLKWPQVDLYVGGDHATRHLIYARFWQKFLYDIKVVSNDEPFKRLEFLGFILAEDGRKMSKRWGNIINPDDIVAQYGADTLRVYEMFMAPFDATAVWNTSSIKGIKRFLERVKKYKDELDAISTVAERGDVIQSEKALNIILNQTIKKVGEDIENFKFNTAVSQMMICMNAIEEYRASRDQFEIFMTLLSPFAPEICSEYTHNEWPIYDNAKLEDDKLTIAIQIGGKLRGTIEIARDESDIEVINKVKSTDVYKKYTIDSNGTYAEPKKIIVVKNKIVNIVL